MAHPTLELYKFDSCPFCQMVLRHIQKLGVQVTYKDIYEDEKNLQFLMEQTGKRTVPCLFIDGRPMFESQDIMAWLTKNQETLAKA